MADTSHSASNALDWEGTYKGIVPCADCEGIQTTITLNKNLTYVLTTVYLGKENDAESELNGKFFWNADGLKIVLEGIENAPNQYFVGENKLFQLDMKGNRITGNLAKNYQLQKVNQL
ncbi:copper resistance protein NlpE [Flavobacterium sp.]|uniref:copper resistance protein NlpE n=1 Tax=Flavobacterium sp. TaxID=239 RepID=UPI00286A3D3A|nr:copper resistance protein NlpE [Flavobacterium sp.]